MTKHRSPEERFWEKVDRGDPDECWLWTAATYGSGYGAFRVGGRSGKTWHAHRWLWQHLNHPLGNSTHVLHRCDNPPCVNPSHLFIGTHTDNMRDMIAKARRDTAVGEDNGLAKLTAASVLEARASYSGQRGECKALCQRYGVHKNTMLAALHGRTWRHV